MKRKIILALGASLTTTALSAPTDGGGDQIIDGIGETSLAARYLFAGDTNDSSRNRHHSTLVTGKNQAQAGFAEDATFGRVLALPGGRDGNHVKLPGVTLAGIDTISVTGWIQLRSTAADQRIFDFGRSGTQNFWCAPADGRQADAGCRARITRHGGQHGQATVAASPLPTGRWTHLAVVLDPANKTLSLYRDGKQIGRTDGVNMTLGEVLSMDNPAENQLFIGKSQQAGVDLNALLHDFRIYNIALSDQQVATIRVNAMPAAARLEADLASLDLGDLSQRTEAFALPARGPAGSALNWQSSQPQVVAADGAVQRPPNNHSAAAATVTLTAIATLQGDTRSRDFTVIVPRLPTDAEIIAAAKEALNPANLTEVRTALILPTQGKLGASIRWASSNPAIIATDGRVTRPVAGQPDVQVTLTATVECNTQSATRIFEARVLAMPADAEIVATDLAAIVLDAAAPVTKSLELPVRGTSGYTTLAWASSDVAVLSPAGVVTRPAFEKGDKTVHLTVTATRDKTSATREFELTVRRLSTKRTLVGVPDIAVTTALGHLPRLPVHIAGIYQDQPAGPQVRVIWPSPENNLEALRVGTYTVAGHVPGTGFQPRAVVTVKEESAAEPMERPPLALAPFPLGDVTLDKDAAGKDTPFRQNRDKFVAGLLESNPDCYLYMFRHAFGQAQPAGATPLGGWDSQTTKLRGHASGHYLTALAQAWAGAAGDETARSSLMRKMNTMVDTLYELSQKSGNPAKPGDPATADPAAVPFGPGKQGYDSDLTDAGIRTDCWNWGKGFISAYPPDQFLMLESGATYGGGNNQIWAPYYTLDKILKGLIDCHEVAGSAKALEVAKGMGLWVHARLKNIPEATLNGMWNRYIAGEFGGMNTELARLHAITGDERFLQAARLFDHVLFFQGDAARSHGLAKNVDTIRGRHANQHIPMIIGALRIYDGTHDPVYHRIADNFWNMSRNSYSYSIGGVAGAANPNNCECNTAQPDTLFTNGFSPGGQNETCATYNLLKLSRDLFMHRQRGEYMDYYEQALYNHILASVDEDNPGNTYHVPLNPGARKGFGNARMDGYTCCNGTALDSNTKLQDSIYFRHREQAALYVNLYVPSTLTWRERGVSIQQSTRFPFADTSTLAIKKGGKFDLYLRVPQWANRGFFIRINGKEHPVEATPGTYLKLAGTWADGDTVEVRMPFGFRLERVMDQPNIASIFYGPMLLAAEEPSALPAWRKVTLDAGDLDASLTGDPATLRFNLGPLRLKPFFEFYNERYSAYLDLREE
jgi:hypothetical protein